MKKQTDLFSSRIGFITSIMGIAIGAGNIWRFPRIVARHGCGAFLILWTLFLFAWSIPLIITELSIGKKFKQSPVGSISLAIGKKFAWMGAFISLVCTGILAYYSSIVGWGGIYSFYSLSGSFCNGQNLESLWNTTHTSLWPLLAHGLSITCATIVLHKGISNGIEKCNKLLIPGFFICLLIIFLRVISLPNALIGIKQLFSVDQSYFFKHRTWIEALIQNAWDTGAGWGLLLVYAGFTRKKEGIINNGIIAAIANNLVSLIMGIIVFGAIYSVNNMINISDISESSSVGLAFIYLPSVFSHIPGPCYIGHFFSSVFFIAFTAAAFSSMISMLMVLSKTIANFNIPNRYALPLSGAIAFTLGIPSSISLSFFSNQDLVWGAGLIINGLIIIYTANRYGITKLRNTVMNQKGDFYLSNWFDFVVKVVLPIEGILLLFWFLIVGLKPTEGSWWNPLSADSLMNILLQWCIVITISLCICKKLQKKL